jgi:intracellular sulfur oxidation DsrE/DsrF family protein
MKIFIKLNLYKMKTFVTSLIVVVFAFSTSVQEYRQKIIFDVTSTDTKVHQATLLMMKVMSTDYPNILLEVMVYGEALPMLMKNQSTVAKDIVDFKDNENVIFTACEVSMEYIYKIGKEQLLDGVGTVENAVPEIAMKQQDGWGYIKVGG